MSVRAADGLKLLDLHRGEAPSPAAADELAAEDLVRVLSSDEHATLVRHERLRAEIRELDAQREQQRRRFTWPWRRAERRERIDEFSERLSALHDEAAGLRRRLHVLGIASDASEDYVALEDGRFVGLTTAGVASACRYAYSRRFDAQVEADAAVEDAARCVDLHGRMLARWEVAYPAPVLATSAALLCRCGRDADAAWDDCAALFDHWRHVYRSCPADRLALSALLVSSMRDGEAPRAAEERARETLDALADVGFPRGRETLWAASLLRCEGVGEGRIERVHDVWRGLVSAGWSMSSATYPYAARLSLARGTPTEVTSRVQEIHEVLGARLPEGEGRARAAAASILAHSDLHPPTSRSAARVLEDESRYDLVGDRVTTLHRRLPEPPDRVRSDCRPVIAALLARLPGSTDVAWEAFEATLDALRSEAGRRIPRGSDIDPLTPAALLLCDRCWGQRASNRVFAFEACAAARNEAFDDVTMFRFTAPEGPAWKPKSEEARL